MSRATLGLACACLVIASGCARSREWEPASRHEAADAAVAVDAPVMAFLSLARAMHHEANLKEEDDIPGAIAALDRLLAAKRPHPTDRIPEIEEVLADTSARIAELYVRQGDTKRANEQVKEGLTHAQAPSYFRGHLLEVGGISEETRAAALRDAGKADEAKGAKAHALELLHQAVAVQEQVVSESLGTVTTTRDGGAK